MGWFGMALVDVLDDLPQAHPDRSKLIALLETMVAALAPVQDKDTGLWYQILDQGNRKGNYLEASGSCMFVYAIAKGVRKEYLPAHRLDMATRGYQGILDNMVEVDAQGLVNLNRICSVGGLGGNPYRDGSFEYYISEKIVTNDYKGVGAFILASVEIEASRK
jgi:unsaturated rhamnogalacturonyl hydrolase